MQRVPLGLSQVEQGRLYQLERLAYYVTRGQRRRELLRRWRAAVNLVVFVIELQKVTWRRVFGWVAEWHSTSREVVSFVGQVAGGQVAWAEDDHRERAFALWQRRCHLQETQPRSVDICHLAIFTVNGARHTAQLGTANVATDSADT